MYYLLLPDLAARSRCLDRLQDAGVNAIFHYVPLHSSPAGRRYGRPHGPLPETAAAADRIVRLPLWVAITDALVDRVVAAVEAAVA
jgi:dTDP-4-amino-4,6-dideoxygalactose transaminase